MLMNSAQCKALNFLIHELIECDIPFEFVDPINSEHRVSLFWASGDSSIDAVNNIVERAQKDNVIVMIGSVNASTWNNADAYFIGYKKPLTVKA
ncbi:hypothetical protein RB43ORF269w [Escherichia phage RB43]|uniref:Uncharacterized protein n=2 Tax=Pseudotevenvirus RB43 TaxID=115991 RepID=Q56BD0_9CAUD|nr:hypothetical protein RB43ORF269w [Escherichia phage RB43]AAX78791.1 hypothetical protein RB43ORF269w [Escherichia phage RB43]